MSLNPWAAAEEPRAETGLMCSRFDWTPPILLQDLKDGDCWEMPSQPLKIGFDADLTIRNAAAIKATLAERLLVERSVSLELNPHAVVDLSFVQLMSAARIRQCKVGGELVLAEPASPKLRDVLQRAGFIEGASAEDLKFWLHSENAQ